MTEPDAELAARLKAFLAEAQHAVEGMQEAAVAVPSPLPRTESTLRAALADTFVVEDFAGDPDVNAVLAVSELVMVGGRRRLRLDDEARGKLLSEARGTAAYAQLLNDLHSADTSAFDAISGDPVRLPTAWLRCFLIGEFGDLTRAPADELRAAVSALERLRFVPLEPRVPTLAEAQRLLNLAELLEPLRILIGTTGGWEGRPAVDRFVGREHEQRRLRGFVDELASETGFETVSRATQRFIGAAAAAVTGRSAGVLVISAQGGLGKTALIAKFVLDHALAQARPFPFAYLDFDRGALQPRDPRLLLVELAGQVALQFPRMAAALSEFRRQLRADLADPRTAPRLPNPFGEFRNLVRRGITYGDRVFLLVLDTTEIVQYDPQALDGVVALIDGLYQDGFPELRVVAAGRSDIPELRHAKGVRAEGQLVRLDPLPVADAVAMVDRLGHDLIGPDWRSTWAKQIVGNTGSAPERREPLSLRVAVELLRGGKDTAARAKMAASIAESGEAAGKEFVAVLYERRILDHVRDPDVRALAWPGLILRRVTREIVRELLAGLCGLTPERAEAAFDGLTREVWIVERRGDALHHRPDLRARTLPLMRRRKPDKFDEVNAAAVSYFETRRTRSAEDRAAWIYHRLLGEESPAALDPDWDDKTARLLAGTDTDLPSGSDAQMFLLAMTAPRLLSDSRIAGLPPRLALEHLARTAPQFGDFDDRKFHRPLVQLPLAEALDGRLSPIALAAAVTLAVTTGRWMNVLPVTERGGPWQAHLDLALRYLRARTLGKHPASQFIDSLGAEPPLQGAAAMASLAQDLAYCHLCGRPEAEKLDAQLADLVLMKPLQPGSDDIRALRLVIAFGEFAFGPALERFVGELRAHQLSQTPLTLSLAEMRALEPFGNLGRTFAAVAKEAQMSQRDLDNAGEQGGTSMRFESRLVAEELLRVLAELREAGEQGRDAIRRFVMARDEDWLLPLAYAAERATAGNVPPSLPEGLSSYNPQARARSIADVLRRWTKPSGSVFDLLRYGDEASDLPGSAAKFLTVAEGTAAHDLDMLLMFHADWRRRVEDWLGGAGRGYSGREGFETDA